MGNPCGVLNASRQRHLESGQYLPQRGVSPKQLQSAAVKGHSGHKTEFEPAEEELHEDDAAAELVGPDNAPGDDGRDVSSLTPDGYKPTGGESQEDDWSDHQDADGTRNEWSDAAREAAKAAKEAHQSTILAHAESSVARENGDKDTHLAAAKLHDAARIAHTKAAKAAEKNRDTTAEMMHKGMASFHQSLINEHMTHNASSSGKKHRDDGRDVDDLEKEEYDPTSESQEDDFEDDQDTDGTRNTLAVFNEWSDQAREAALLARKASLRATTSKFGTQSLAWPSHAQEADDLSKRALAATKNDHKAAIALHHQAAEAHQKASEETKGSLAELEHATAARMHQRAAFAHEGAWRVKSRAAKAVQNGFASEDQRKFMWSQNPDIAESWAHGQHTSDKDHKMPEVSGPDVKGPLAAAERKKAKRKMVDNDESDDSLQGGLTPDKDELDTQAQLRKKTKKGLIDNDTYNTWTDAAREAAIASRRAEGMSRSASTPGDHQVASNLHAAAIDAHHEAARQAMKEGKYDVARQHRAMARSHNEASDAHDQGNAEPGKNVSTGATRILKEYKKSGTHNTWTDAAREAAAEAKHATAKANIAEKFSNHKVTAQAHYDAANAHKLAAHHGVEGAEAAAKTHEAKGDKFYKMSRTTQNVWTDEAREAAKAAREASSHAAGKTNATTGGRGIVANPAEHSNLQGAHDTSARAHESMAFAHYTAAQSAKKEGKVDEAKDHMSAAKAHDQARQAHEAAHKAGAWSNTRNTDHTQDVLTTFLLENSMNKIQRKIILSGLTANCSCDKDKAALNSLSDEAIQNLFLSAGVANAEKCPECGGPMEDGVCQKCGYKEGETENDGASGKAEGSNADVTGSGKFAQAGGKGTKDEYNKGTTNRQSITEWEATAPPEVVAQWKFAQQINLNAKEQKVKQITANISNKDVKDKKTRDLMKKEHHELDEILALMATTNRRIPTPPPIYVGQSAPVINRDTEDSDTDDVLPLPSMNSFRDEDEQPAKKAN